VRSVTRKTRLRFWKNPRTLFAQEQNIYIYMYIILYGIINGGEAVRRARRHKWLFGGAALFCHARATYRERAIELRISAPNISKIGGNAVYRDKSHTERFLIAGAETE
jgi:hypothetical protein